MPGGFLATMATGTLSIQLPVAQSIPVALDQLLTATMAPGTATLLIMNVSGIGVPDTILLRNSARTGQGFRRCRRCIKAVIGVVRRKVHGHIRA